MRCPDIWFKLHLNLNKQSPIWLLLNYTRTPATAFQRSLDLYYFRFQCLKFILNSSSILDFLPAPINLTTDSIIEVSLACHFFIIFFKALLHDLNLTLDWLPWYLNLNYITVFFRPYQLHYSVCALYLKLEIVSNWN